MSGLRAIDVAKWFIRNDLDSPRDTFDGNMKLQKLLYFAQLIHVAKNDKLLFSEDMRAYENGTVVNEVRLIYKNKPTTFINEAMFTDFSYDDEEINKTLRLTADLFGEMSARELSDLNHELPSWKIPYHASRTNIPNVYRTEKNIIDPEGKLFKEDVNKVKKMLDAFLQNEQSEKMDYEVINGVTYYFDSNEVELTDDILAILEDMNGPDEAYTLTYDKEQGLIIL